KLRIPEAILGADTRLGSRMCRFFKPMRLSVAMSVLMSNTLLPGGMGSDALSMTASRHACSLADADGVKSHSRILGIPGLKDAIVWATPSGCHWAMLAELPGKAVQKS